MVGMTGFEPATSYSRSKRATKLRHIPILEYFIILLVNNKYGRMYKLSYLV